MKKFNLLSGVIVPAVLAVEREIFFLTGCKLPILAAYWRHRAKKLQARLEMEHFVARGWYRTA